MIFKMRIRTSNPVLETSDKIHNDALILIEDMRPVLDVEVLAQLGMTVPNRPMHDTFNHELKHNTITRHWEVETVKKKKKNVLLLNRQQNHAYDALMKVVNDEIRGIFF